MPRNTYPGLVRPILKSYRIEPDVSGYATGRSASFQYPDSRGIGDTAGGNFWRQGRRTAPCLSDRGPTNRTIYSRETGNLRSP